MRLAGMGTEPANRALNMEISEKRMNELIFIIGDLKISQWHKLVGEKKMKWNEWAELCRMNYKPKQKPVDPIKMNIKPPYWNEDAFIREMT